jgi:Mg-chelatase subunit ChlD
MFVGVLVLSGWWVSAGYSGQGDKTSRPQIEVVFCVDTTGSMDGLIYAAKQKVWTICNQVVGGRPIPQLKLGLVAYRDRGDAQKSYVTKVYDLTDDLDAVYNHLMEFQAGGGGDFPESVNQALHETVTKIQWSKSKDTLRLIFLVGDAPPHMDYPDDVKYPETCKLAVQRGILINTIQCGRHAQTQRDWQEIARLAGGAYVQIDADGGPVINVPTPFDEELVKINKELVKTTLTFGKGAFREEAEAKKDAAAKLPTQAALSRAAYAGKADIIAAFDLLDNIKANKVRLEDLETEELPTVLRDLSPQARETFLIKLDQERMKLKMQALEFDRKRNEYLQSQLDRTNQDQFEAGFDQQVLQILRQQAKQINIQYAPGAGQQK